jgi:hypothetical protein
VPAVTIPTRRITDWDTFHDVFAEILGFPDFYGRNMAAWNDCLMYADADDGMRNFVVPPGDVLTLVIEEARDFAHRCPELYLEILEGAAWVNYARVEAGERAIVAVSSSGRDPRGEGPPSDSRWPSAALS